MKKNMKSFIARLLVLCMIVGLLPAVALAAEDGTAGNSVYYYISPDTVSLAAGGSTTLTLNAGSADGSITVKSVVWSSSSSAATVTGNNTSATVTALAAGSANITATVTFSDDSTGAAICKVSISAAPPTTVAVTGVKLDKATLSLTVGETDTLTATVEPSNATDKTVTWKSSDETVATVSDGKVTAVAAGKATITATAGDKSATCEVTVSTAIVEEVKPEITTGEDGTVTAKAEVKEDKMDKLVDSAKEAAAKDEPVLVEISVDVDADKADKLVVELPTTSLEKLAKEEKATLRVSSELGGIELDNTALNSLVGQADGSSITLDVAHVETEKLEKEQQTALEKATDKPVVFDLSLMSGTETIHNFKQGNTKGQLTITLPYELPTGKTASDLRVYYLNAEGKFERHRSASLDTKTGKVKFTTTHLSTYVITTSQMIQEFKDVLESDWYDLEVIDWSAANGIVTGRGSADVFAPNVECSRAEIVTFLWRLAGKPTVDASVKNPFTDVPKDEWFYDAALWASSKGIVDGYGNSTTFAPYEICDRSQIVTFLWRYCGKETVNSEHGYTDVDAGIWYEKAAAWGKANGVVKGYGNSTTFAPSIDCSRAQAVTFLWRADALED